MFLDAHCHLADPRLDGSRDSLLRQAAACRIGGFIQGGVGPNDWQRQRELAGEDWFLTFGLHPWWVAENDDAACADALAELPAAMTEPADRPVVALGETGLDFFDESRRGGFDRQRRYFDAQLELARDNDWPLVLHLVSCHGEAPQRLARIAPNWRGIVHGFTGSLEVARAYLKLGLTLSIGGAVARPGYKKLKNALSQLAPGEFVVESDAPDAAPTRNRRVRNEPAMLWITASAIAAIRGERAEDVLATSTVNLRRIFDLEWPHDAATA